MGLDMYLKKKTYIGAEYEHRNVTGGIDIQIANKPVTIQLGRVSEIIESIGYWRKANHIHKWFVDNCQQGNDDCRETYVSTEKLKMLLSDCKIVKENKELAESVLPTQSGFFFGPTEIDDFYFEDIDNTIKIIETAIKESEDGEIYYHSSW